MFLNIFYALTTILWCISLIIIYFLIECFDKVEDYAKNYTQRLATLWTAFWFLMNAITLMIQPYMPRLTAKETFTISSIAIFVLELIILFIAFKLIRKYILPNYLIPFLNKRALTKNSTYYDNTFDTDKKLVAKDDSPDEIYEEVKKETPDKDYDKKLDERIKKYQSDK